MLFAFLWSSPGYFFGAPRRTEDTQQRQGTRELLLNTVVGHEYRLWLALHTLGLRGRDGGCDVRLATYNYRTNQACNLQPRTLEPAATCNQQNPRTRNVLVCRYARSLRLAARQNTPAFDGAFYRPNGTSYQLQPSFHTYSTEPEPTARARRAGEEFY